MRTHAALLAALVLVMGPDARGDEPAGVVRLSRGDYDRLKDEADGPSVPHRRKVRDVPPAIEAARYDLKVDASAATLELAAEVVVKGPVHDARLVLPSAGRLESFAERGPAAVLLSAAASEDRKTALRFTAPGRYHVTLRYFPTERDLPGGVRAYEFTSVSASSARLAAAAGIPGAIFEWSAGGGSIEPLPAGVARPLPTSSLVSLRVKTAGGLPTAPAEKPVVIAEIVDAARPQRERLLVRTLAKVSVSRSEIPQLVVQFGPGSKLLSVSGPDEPSLVIAEDGQAVLRFGKPLQGEATFSMLTWREMPAAGMNVELQPTKVPAAASVRSFLLVTPAAIRRYEPVANDGLQRTDSSDLPALARAFVAGSTRAYRTVDAAKARLVFASPLRDVAPAADTLVDEASLLTVFGDGGVRTDQRRFSIQTKRPFFEIPIGAGEEVVSVAVDAIPVKSQGQAERLVVVLPPSTAKRRVVQVVTKHGGVETPKKGELRVEAGPLPGSASLATWTVVLPEDRRYRVLESAGLRKAGWLAAQARPEAIAEAQPSNWLGADANATVSGRVTDERGTPLPGVTVEIRAGSTKRTTVSDAGGNYRFAGLLPGRYTVTSSLSGFSASPRSLDVKAGGGYFEPLAMSLSVHAEAMVTAEAPAIVTSKAYQASALPKAAPPPVDSRADGGVEGGVAGGVMGGVLGGVKPGDVARAAPASPAFDNVYLADGVTQTRERSNAGVRSLPVELTANGKRLVLAGPLAGASPVWVRIGIK